MFIGFGVSLNELSRFGALHLQWSDQQRSYYLHGGESVLNVVCDPILFLVTLALDGTQPLI